jgi:alkylhydroperoxidase family enzyme
MPRLRQVPRSEASPEVAKLYDHLFGDRDPVAEPGTDTGTSGNWWTVFALVPDVFHHAVAGFGLYRSEERRLDPKLRELGQTRAGFARGSQFVFSQHCKSCRAVGLSEEQIRAIPAWSSSDVFSAEQRAVLAYADDLVLAGGRVADATFERLREFLSDEEILELTYITCTYDLHATICRALRLEYDDVSERIQEIAAPGGEQSADIMRAISRPGDV